MASTDTRIAFEPGAQPGDRLTRNYEGKLIVVDIRPDGFHFRGRAYASLSKIAMSVTGVSTNGPLWFGLRRQRRGGPTRKPIPTPTMSHRAMPRPAFPSYLEGPFRRVWP